MIRDLTPKQYTSKIAGKIYNILPATLGMQAKIINYFEVLNNEQTSWADLWTVFSSGEPIINSHLAYLMIDWNGDVPTYKEFLKLLERKGNSNDLLDMICKTWHDAIPKEFKQSDKKKRVKKIITSLIIISAMICWVQGTIYLIKTFLN